MSVRLRTALFHALTVVIGVLAAFPNAATAQDTAVSRPFRGLFGSPSTTSVPRQSLNLTVNLAEAYDDDLLAPGSGPSAGPAPALNGLYTMLTAAADYSRRGRKVQVGINASSSFRYYGDLDRVSNTASGVGAGFSAALPGGLRWMLNQTVAFAPSYLYALFPGMRTDGPGELPPATAPDYAVNDVASFSYNTATTFTRRVTERGSLAVGGTVTATKFVNQVPGRENIQSYTAQAEFSRGLRRNSSTRLAYRLQAGDSGFAVGASTVEHLVEMGLETSRPLSATRRATFAISLGPSTVMIPAEALGRSADEVIPSARRLYRLAGAASFGFQFGRTWQTRATYNRGLEYLPGVQAPVLTGGVSASLDGLLSRRLDLTASGGYAAGTSALRSRSTYNTYTGEMRLRYALSRSWAAYVQYLYYFYDFRGTTQLVTGLPPRLERNGARVGLTLWLPVVKR